MKSKILLCLIPLLMLSSCSNGLEKPAAREQQTTSPSVQASSTCDAIWDTFVKQNGDSIDALQQTPEEPDMFSLYLEGLQHESPIVRWYSANKSIEYAFDSRSQELLIALEKLRSDPDEKVKDSAIFAISAINKSFDGDKFTKTKDSKRAAFYRYHGLNYNDGKVWLYTETSAGGWYTYDVGGSIDKMSWSPDGSKLSVECGGRNWHFVSFVDLKDYSLHEVGLFSYLIDNQDKFNYKLKVNQRPDPQVTLLEWSPEGDKMLLFYSFRDDEYKLQSGAAVYDILRNDFQEIWPYPPTESEGVAPERPKHFKWQG